MNGTRKSAAVNSTQLNLYAFASSDATSASLIVANYNYLFENDNYSDLTTSETVTVAFHNLPFSGPVTVDRYLIDAQTSNLNYWVAAGVTPPPVPVTQLQKVESFSASPAGRHVISACNSVRTVSGFSLDYSSVKSGRP